MICYKMLLHVYLDQYLRCVNAAFKIYRQVTSDIIIQFYVMLCDLSLYCSIVKCKCN